MKHCNKCNTTKPDSEFYKRKTEKRLQNLCKACFNKYCTNRWIELKKQTVVEFGNICADCKQTFHYAVFEFHHLDPNQKDSSWQQLRLKSNEKRKKELEKCIMLCANCHRLRHVSERELG